MSVPVCETCKYWSRHHTPTPWFPPSSGECAFVLPPYVTRLLEQLAPPYVETTTQQDDTCSSHVEREIKPDESSD